MVYVSPFLELAKKLVNTNLFDIYLCSTPANLGSIEANKSIRLIELNLDPLPDLPSHLRTTNGLPSHLMPTLKKPFDNAKPNFSRILNNLKPDLLIYDMIQPWAPVLAAPLGISSVLFITTNATMAASMFHLYLNEGDDFPIESIFYHDHELWNVKEILESSANGLKDKDCVMGGVDKSSSIVLVKSFKEIEGKYADYLSQLTSKRIVPVGPLVVDHVHVDTNKTMRSSGSIQKPRDPLFLCLSEYFLSKEDLIQMALGLKMSNVNFIWVLRFPKGENSTNMLQALPLGFVERIKDSGLLVEGWAPQAKILGQKNIGGFVSHCGWSSVMEAMKFGVPIIAMPMHLDQPVNARLVVEVGMGMEVLRDDEGVLKQEMVAEVVNKVVVSKLGENVREKAKKVCVDLKMKWDEEIKIVIKELLQLCKSGHARRRVVGGRVLYKAKSDDLRLQLAQNFPLC